MSPMLVSMNNATIDQASLDHKVYRRATDVVWNMIDGEAVLLGPSTGACYGLNTTAAAVWESLGTPTTAQQAAETIACRFEVSIEVALNDTRALLKELLERKLVEFVA